MPPKPVLHKATKTIRVSQEVYDLLEQARMDLRCRSMDQALRALLSHRQPGGWIGVVERGTHT